MKMNKRLAGLLNTPAQRWSPLLLRLQAYWRQLSRASARFSPAVAWRYAWR